MEDRLKTLEQIAKIPALKSVRLFLADWGYNTQTMRDQVVNQGGNFAGDRSLDQPLGDSPDHDYSSSFSNSSIKLISLETFGQNLINWL